MESNDSFECVKSVLIVETNKPFCEHLTLGTCLKLLSLKEYNIGL